MSEVGSGLGKKIVWVGARVIALLCLILAAGIFSSSSTKMGFGFFILVMAISCVVIVRPFPRFGLDSRAFAAVALLLFGLLAGGSAIQINRISDAARLVDLKSSDPAAYLGALIEDTPSLWLKELAVLDPAQFEVENARLSGQVINGTDVTLKSEGFRSAELEKAMQAVADERAAEIEAVATAAAAKVAAKEALAAAEAASLKADAAAKVAEEAAAAASLKADAEAKVAEEAAAANKMVADFESWKGKMRDWVEKAAWPQALSTYRSLDKEGRDIETFVAEIEGRAVELVKKIPAADVQDNLDGYRFLEQLRPANAAYAAKAVDYTARLVADVARKKAEREKAVTRLRKKVDQIEGVTWYQHPNQPKYLNSRSTVYLYIGRRGDVGTPTLRMRVQYAASDWLFVQSVYAWNGMFREQLINGPFDQDNNSTIWEWTDVVPTGYQIEILRTLSTSKEAVLRFEGRQYQKDVPLSSGDKQALRDVLTAYDVMMGN